MVPHTGPVSAIRRILAGVALTSGLLVASVPGAAHAAALKKCPSASSLSSAAGTGVKLEHHGKLAGQLVCEYITHGAALADLTVQTVASAGVSPTVELKRLEAGDKATRYKVTLLHGLGSGAFEATLKGSISEVDVVDSGHVIQVGSLVVSPSRVVAVARAVVG